MAELGPSTRFRGVALTMLAAGGVFVAVAVLAVSGLGWLPTRSTAGTVSPGTGDDQAGVDIYGASGILPQTTELSPSLLQSIVQARDPGADAAVGIPAGGLSISPAALAAYHRAESALALQQPRCEVSWTLLAGLGRVISDHGGGSLDPSGNSTRPILGPQLDGSPGLANIRDTDGGRLDTDSEWDRAVGPMQIIPTVWRRVGGDSDGDGFGSPHNMFDSALAAGRYLCEGDADLEGAAAQARAVFRYQRSDLFVRAVMAWTQAYGPRLVPNPDPGPALPPVEQVPPQSDTPPPAGDLPTGEPQAPASVLPPPGPPPPPGRTPPPPGRTPPPDTTTPPPDTTTPPPDTTTPPPDTTTPPPDTTTPPPDTTTPPPDTTTPPPDTTTPQSDPTTPPPGRTPPPDPTTSTSTTAG